MIKTVLAPVVAGLAVYLAFQVGLLMVAFMLVMAILHETSKG